ncbi:MAG: imidazole glycerol phosphate synthase subunit HisH [Rhodospirillaceae bacterium]
MMQIVIVDYGSGNLRSAAKAFERAALDSDTSASVSVTSDADEVATADRVVLPGVGAFADCKAGLENLSGMVDALQQAVITKGRPFFGICVGMQLMATIGLEHGETDGFDWIPGKVEALSPSEEAGPGGTGPRIPHMGWNRLNLEMSHPVLSELGYDPFAYFVHSYHVVCDDPETVCATVDYGQTVTAAIGRDTLFGTQFHPEKSQALGLRLIGNFLKWAP